MIVKIMKEFDYNSDFNDIGLPWLGHRYFAKDLIEIIKPSIIVELGTWRGSSMFSMLQGIKNLNLETVFFAIDTWEGDKHAGLYEGDDYLKEIERIKNKYYAKCKVNIVRKRFEDAVDDFSDNTIDILHIDGLHTYDAVKSDYETWLPKLTANGIILFHDISVFNSDFGVHRLWKELKSKEQNFCLSFEHSHGLGILTRDEVVYNTINNLINTNCDLYFKKVYNELNSENRILKIELDAIYNSRYWKIKEFIKKIIGK